MNVWWGVAFAGILAVLLAFELGVANRHGHEVRVRRAIGRVAAYVALALAFAAALSRYAGSETAIAFVTGYVIELSLSLDNLFVFYLIFQQFAVPASLRERVLFWGIAGAILMRGVIIVAGAELVAHFHWVLYLFGAFLAVTGVKILIRSDLPTDVRDSRIVAFLRRRFRVTPAFEEDRFVVRRDGRVWVTPLFVVLVLVECSDLLFATDSIPAIFAVTDDPLVLYSSNVFAILGLRAMFVVLVASVERFRYIRPALAVILCGIGAKMLLKDVLDIPVALMLGFTVAAILVVVVATVFSELRAARPGALALRRNPEPVPVPGDEPAGPGRLPPVAAFGPSHRHPAEH
jgi:tellurite resistance protein TerC